MAPGIFVKQRSQSDGKLLPMRLRDADETGGKEAMRHPGPPSLSTSKQVLGPMGNPGQLTGIELRLREVLTMIPAWPPNRLRAQAAINTLAEVARMPSTIAPVLKLIVEEASLAILVPPRTGVVDGVATYFELCESLKQDIDQLMSGAQRARTHIQGHSEVLTRRNELIHDLERQLAERQAVVHARDATIVAHLAEIKDLKKTVDLFDEEREAFQRRLGQSETLRRESEDMVKSVKVRLYIEQKKVLEQAQLFKEHRTQARAGAVKAANEVKRWQRLLLRAQHAQLRGEGRGAECMDLIELSVDKQLELAMRWADGLPEVKTEGSLAPVATDVPGAARSPTKPNKAPQQQQPAQARDAADESGGGSGA